MRFRKVPLDTSIASPSTQHSSDAAQRKIVHLIAKELSVKPQQVAAAVALLADPSLDPQQEAVKYVNGQAATDDAETVNVPDVKAALEGARDILVERFAETAELLAKLRAYLWEQGVLTSKVIKGKETAEDE